MLIRTVSIIVIVLLSIYFFTTGSRSGSKTNFDNTQIVRDTTSNTANYARRALTFLLRDLLKKAF
jgi:hypothetical protein